MQSQVSPLESVVGKIKAHSGAPAWALDVDGFLNGYQAVTVATDGSALVAGDDRIENQTAAAVDDADFVLFAAAYNALLCP